MVLIAEDANEELGERNRVTFVLFIYFLNYLDFVMSVLKLVTEISVQLLELSDASLKKDQITTI